MDPTISTSTAVGAVADERRMAEPSMTSERISPGIRPPSPTDGPDLPSIDSYSPDTTEIAGTQAGLLDFTEELRDLRERVKHLEGLLASSGRAGDGEPPEKEGTPVRKVFVSSSVSPPVSSPPKARSGSSSDVAHTAEKASPADAAVVVEYNDHTRRRNDDEGSQCPTRITIRNHNFLRLLEEVSGVTLPPPPCSLEYPFKLLLAFRPQIESRLGDVSSNPDRNHNRSVTRLHDAAGSAEQPTRSEYLFLEDKALPDIPAADTFQTQPEASLTGEETGSLSQIYRFMSTHLQPLFALQASFRERTTDRVSFKDLWLLFEPGCTIILGPEDNSTPYSQQAYCLLETYLNPSRSRRRADPDSDDNPFIPDRSGDNFFLHLHFLRYDGRWLERDGIVVEIPPFWGEKPINQLPAFPIQFSHRPDFPSKLATRGRRFLELHYGSAGYQSVSGLACFAEVFVDFEAARKEDPNVLPAGCGLSEMYVKGGPTGSIHHGGWCMDFDDRLVDRRLGELFRHRLQPRFPLASGAKSVDLDEADLLLLPPNLPAFSLQTKSWNLMDVTLLSKAASQNRGKVLAASFRDLVIEAGPKNILRAVVNGHGRLDSPEDSDVVGSSFWAAETKSNTGVVILLHGPPGCGITATASGLAGSTKPYRPLYQLTCGDLPSEPSAFEKELRSHLARANGWNCMVLLEDAEIYLSERDDSIDRNRIVSIFLRILDDFTGTMILGSNRVGLIDEALKSRVHLAVYLAKQNRAGAEKMWRMALNRLRDQAERGESDIRLEERSIISWASNRYDRFSEGGGAWTGRLIDNAVKMAIALAMSESRGVNSDGSDDDSSDIDDGGTSRMPREVVLEARHFSVVDGCTQAFNAYLADCRGKDEERAAEFHLRADSSLQRTAPPPYGRQSRGFPESGHLPSQSGLSGWPQLVPRSRASPPQSRGRVTAGGYSQGYDSDGYGDEPDNGPYDEGYDETGPSTVRRQLPTRSQGKPARSSVQRKPYGILKNSGAQRYWSPPPPPRGSKQAHVVDFSEQTEEYDYEPDLPEPPAETGPKATW